MPPEFLSWLTDPAQSGAGALYDFGCYGVDLMTWLMHGETPLTVTAVVESRQAEIYRNVDDDATLSLPILTRRPSSWLLELAFQPQGYGSLRQRRLRYHRRRGQAPRAPRTRQRRAAGHRQSAQPA